MQTIQAINNRITTRHFTSQKIDDEKLREIIRLAQLAPSVKNSQPVHVYAVEGETLEKIRQKHSEAFNNHQEANPDLEKLPYTQWAQQQQDNMRSWENSLPFVMGGNYQSILNEESANLFNAQTILYLTLPKGFSYWSLIDLGSFAQTLMIAAADKKVATMPAEHFVRFPEQIRQVANIPDDRDIILGIGIGYRDEDAIINNITAKRQPISEIFTQLN